MQESGTISFERAVRIPLPKIAGAVGQVADFDPQNLDIACARVLFLGEDNPQSRLDCHALWDVAKPGKTCAGGLLRKKILQLPAAVYRACWRTNLSLEGPQDWVNGAAEARARLLRVELPWSPWQLIVCLGRKVSKAMGVVLNAPPTRSDRLTIVGIPHPSGRTRDYNAPEARQRVRDLLAELEPGVPWGSAFADSMPKLRGEETP